MNDLTINGRPAADMGIAILLGGSPGVWSGARRERDTVPLLGRDGVRASRFAIGAAKEIPLALRLKGTIAERRAKLDDVLWHLDGMLVVEWSDAPGRYQLGRVPVKDVRARFAELEWADTGQLQLDFRLVLDTPLSFDLAATVVGFDAATEIGTPLGTATSAPLIEVPGAVASSDVVVTYRGINGSILAELIIDDPDISSSEALLIDCGRSRILIFDGVDSEEAMELYVGGSFPILDPGDGNPQAGVWPTIECSHAGSLTYRRAWE